LKKILTGFFCFWISIILISALLSPLVFSFTQQSDFFSQYPFHRVFNRVLMISALLCLYPLLRYWNISWKSLLGGFSKSSLVQILRFSGLGLASLALLLIPYFIFEYREFTADKSFFKIGEYILSAAAIGFLEEILFRGVFFLALLPLLRIKPYVWILINSFFFASVHFLKAKPLESTIQWDSGLFLWQQMVTSIDFNQEFYARWMGLFLVGITLCMLVTWKRKLWPSMGLHAGWVLGLKGVMYYTTALKTPDELWLSSTILAGFWTDIVLLGLILSFYYQWKNEDRSHQ
jgi:membrane protease YdiL (CAAX protease family)